MHTLDQLRSGALTGARRLDLSCDLEALPPEVFDLADTLEVLNLSDNQLRSLPHDLPRLHRLRVIFCSNNPFTDLPEVLGDCHGLQQVGFKACQITNLPGAALPPQLRWLTLTDNAIRQVPPELGRRPALQKLMLAGNRLRDLPDTLADLQNLELLRLSANDFAQLPAWLTHLPRLAWLALAGNPLGWLRAESAPLARVPRTQLRVDGLLGEGASGHIYRVHQQGSAQGLALKLFKGLVTSDGLPEHEMAACLAAGQHPALCTPIAELADDHCEGTRGLLLPLIPPHYTNLAGPPSLDSCTRDVYAPDLRIPMHALLRLARDMAGALAHLHQHGVMHGDFYAHNILWDPATGQALLSDFGAGTLLPVDQPGLTRAMLALEVRAFGCLLQELVCHAEADAVQGPVWAKLDALAQACSQDPTSHRPAMVDVARQLASS